MPTRISAPVFTLRVVLGSLTLFVACLAWTQVNDDVGAPSEAGGVNPSAYRQAPDGARRDPRSATTAERRGVVDAGRASRSPLDLAIAALTNARTFPAGHTLPTYAAPDWKPIDVGDGSDGALEALYVRAARGDQDALAAYLTMAVHQGSFVARSQDLLYANAAHQSVLALIELSTRASVGYGFQHADAATSILYEYLAWRTGHWMVSADPGGGFVPTIARRWTEAEFQRALHAAEAVPSPPSLPHPEASVFARSETATNP